MSSKKLLSGTGILVLAILFVATTFLANSLLRGARVDLTEGNLYSLSDGTREVLKDIDEPINLYFYFSDKASASLPPLRTYANRVREMLEEIRDASGGKVNLSVIDPLPFSEDEDRATAFGLQAVPIGNGESVFFGLAGTNSVNGEEAITFFQPDKESFLEYDVAKLIHGLAQQKLPVVGIISSLPLQGNFDMATRSMGEPWAVVQQMKDLFDLRTLGPDTTTIDKEIDVLMVVHPKNLSDDQQYAIDQFVLRGGRLALFVDPNSETDTPPEDPNNPGAAMFAPKNSDLPKLLAAWGLSYDSNQFVGDAEYALQVGMQQGSQPVRHLGILGLTKDAMNQKDVISANLETVNLASAGFIASAANATTKIEPILQSSKQAQPIPVDKIKFSPDPSVLHDDFKPTGTNYILAGRVAGKVKTAFPERSGAEHLTESKGDISVLVFADTDLLTNRLWVQTQNFFGQTLLSPFANNADLVSNAVDNLTGSSALISIRGRAVAQRPFTKVEQIRRAAEGEYRDTEKQLKDRLADTERKLSELQQGKSDEQKLILSAEQKQALENFQKEKLEIRKDLRQVQRNLDADIEALGTRLKWLNIGLIPLLLTLGVLAFVYTRNRRAKG
jgi:ABC-type uncharacterized transport system involved in gliding motility auxiliary subunit